MKFVPGQRWISETEPELGLGLVLEVAFRRVQISFPAGGETRQYAAESAPVKRVRFAEGDEVKAQDGTSFVVESIREEEGLLIYAGDGQEMSEAMLCDSLSFDKPEDRLLNGVVDDYPLFDLRFNTLRHRSRIWQSPVRGFVGGRVELIPHQLFIAHEVSRRHAPRVLLADEVGLGKTIEACLILHRLVVSGKVRRALILVPDALIHQWFVELLRRFNLNFKIFDEGRCEAIAEGDATANPFLEEQLVLCGIDFLAENATRGVQAVTAGWDLLIVDEAHHLAWSPEESSPAYALVEQLAIGVPGLLLLTATPEQLGLESHFARLRLLDPNRYPDFEHFVKDHDQFEAVAKKAEKVLAKGDELALQELLDRHGPGRVMFRNTRSAMTGFPVRVPHLIPLADAESDPRVQWLADFLRERPTTKVLVICRTRDEVLEIDKTLRGLINVKTALFHEDLELVQRDRQAAWFAEDDGARLLIASEIGGEGRNFQFVHDLVLISLPDDPELLEQRIGRLDRIGQTSDIHIYVPYLESSAEAGRVRWYHEGLKAFEEPMSGGYEFMQKFGARLDRVDDALIKETRTFRDSVVDRMERGRDRLLELNSFRPETADQVVEHIEAEDESNELEKYLLQLFDPYGVHAEHLDHRDYLFVPGHLFDDTFPLKKEGMRVTYERQRAIAREDITLMSWDHPLVDSGMDMLLGSERGNSAWAEAEGPSGIVLQALFVLECVAPAELEASRFLPPTPILVNLDHQLKEVASAPEKLQAGDPHELLDHESMRRELLPSMIKAARKTAEEKMPAMIEMARSKMIEVLGTECQRLQALSEVNDHVRPEEVALARQQLEDLSGALGEARIRLDAIRVVRMKAGLNG